MERNPPVPLQLAELPQISPDAAESSRGVIIDLNEFDFAPSWAKQLATQKKSGQNDDPLHTERTTPQKGIFSDRRKNRHFDTKRSASDDRRLNTKPRDHTKPKNRQYDDKKNKHPQPRFRIELLPEASGTESLARQIRLKSRAYPVYELARIILQKQERYAVRVLIGNHPQTGQFHSKTCDSIESSSDSDNAASKSQQHLYHCLVDDTVWLSSQSALQHILKNHLEKFYEIHNQTVDPPKGNFTHIAICGITGAIISPPNFHGYQSAIRETYRSKSIRMPFEDYRAKVKILKDEPLLQQWLKQASQKTFYTPRPSPLQSASDASTESQQKHHSSAQDTESSPGAQAEQTQPTSEAQTDTGAQAPEQNPLPEPDSAHDSAAHDTPETETNRRTQQLTILSFAELEKHFLENFSQQAIRPVSVFIMRSETSRTKSDPPIIRQINNTLEAEQNFPHNIGRNLIHQLTQLGLHFFKTPQNILHVTAVRPTPFSADENSVKENIRSILRHIQLNPRCNRRQLLDNLVPDFEQNPASSSENSPAELTAQPESTDSTPRQKAAAQEALSVLKDLHWLIRQGHIVEYASGELELPDPQKQILKSHTAQNRRHATANTNKHRSRQKNKRTAKMTDSSAPNIRADDSSVGVLSEPLESHNTQSETARAIEEKTLMETDSSTPSDQKSSQTDHDKFEYPDSDPPFKQTSATAPATLPSNHPSQT